MRPCWTLTACLYTFLQMYTNKAILYFCIFSHTFVYFTYIYIYACVETQNFNICFYFRGLGWMCTLFWTTKFYFHQPAALFLYFCLTLFLPVLSSDNSLPRKHTAFKTVGFLKVTSYNYILTFFSKRRIQKENWRSLLLYHTCSLWKHLKWSKSVSPYIRWL